MWSEFRLRKLKAYRTAKSKGEVDEDIIDFLDFINSLPDFVTLSSCSGRIAVIDTPEFGKKLETEFLGKWHGEVEVQAVIEAAKKSKKYAWLIQYPPIIHIACRDFKSAERLLAISNNAGFRRSGLISFKNIVVEVSSLERIELPIAYAGKMLVDSDYLRMVVEFANKKLREGKRRLERLEEELKNLASGNSGLPERNDAN